MQELLTSETLINLKKGDFIKFKDDGSQAIYELKHIYPDFYCDLMLVHRGENSPTYYDSVGHIYHKYYYGAIAGRAYITDFKQPYKGHRLTKIFA